MLGHSIDLRAMPIALLALAWAGAACSGESDSKQGDGAGASASVTDEGDGAGGGGASSAVDAIPCGVAEVVINDCQGCHSAQMVGGAIPLLTHDDWHQASPFYADKEGLEAETKVYEVAKIRIGDGSMPQGATLAEADFKVLDEWLAAGAPAGTEDDASCIADLATASATGSGDIVRDKDDECGRPGAEDPIVARDGERCFNFLTHGQSGVDDTTKFPVPPGESYHEIYYATPWENDDVMTRFGHQFDRLEVLHHYLIFTNNNSSRQPGDVAMNVAGSTLGTGSTLIGGWAVGGCGQEFPEDLGGELPDSPLVMIQWHMYNLTGETQDDGSELTICVVPESDRDNIAGVTFLGTESLGGISVAGISLGGMGPGEQNFTTECKNESEGKVTLLGFTPHMHLIGTNMKTELRRLDGTVETIFDKPFSFDYQVGYTLPQRVVVEPGETLITTCSYFNDTGANVGFGESTGAEMCYNYVSYYPAGALDIPGIASLIGATNICWGPVL
ncbi:MAG: hypothetical protein OEZ06_13335 [Myxococcales bacterium]|nr:hypothetical protein [Myxococcales bacterium]